jgi:hypothetical protein
VTVRAILLGVVLAVASVADITTAAERCADCVTAGAASSPLTVPPGTPLAGYGNPKRRLLFPDVLGQHPYAFWFAPSAGTQDPLAARALVLESGTTRVAWVTLDLIAIDRAFTRALQERLAAAGIPAATLIVSASHTHSGPGAFLDSGLMSVVASDRLDAVVRDALVESAAAVIRQADGARVPALVATVSVAAPPVTLSRLGRPLDSEIVVLKVTNASGAPLALVWNFSIHGTMLPASNLRLSGDVMGVASARLEQKLGAPALFVNGAVGDVSPARHGEAAMRETADQLAAAVEAGWTRARPASVSTLRVAQRQVGLPAAALSLRGCLGRWMPAFVRLPLWSALPDDTELVGVALGDTSWVTIPGELQTALGQTIKREGRELFASTFVAGLSNDYLGYFVTPIDAQRSGYVACATLYGPDAGACLTDAAVDLLYRLRGRSRSVTRTPSTCDFRSGDR